MMGFLFLDLCWDQGEGFMGFLNIYYYCQIDQLDGELEVLFIQGVKFVNINYMIVCEIVDSEECLVWNDDSFFGQIFGQ